MSTPFNYFFYHSAPGTKQLLS